VICPEDSVCKGQKETVETLILFVGVLVTLALSIGIPLLLYPEGGGFWVFGLCFAIPLILTFLIKSLFEAAWCAYCLEDHSDQGDV
jgi:hypothetical protein